MNLSKALTQTYRVSESALADSEYMRPVQARVAALPSLPQVTLLGEVSAHLRLIKPIHINFEEAGEGKILASDDIFYMYGEGNTRKEALGDYIISLSEYYELLESHKDTPSMELFRFLQSYLQPITQ